jgi:hypothetical protein
MLTTSIGHCPSSAEAHEDADEVFGVGTQGTGHLRPAHNIQNTAAQATRPTETAQTKRVRRLRQIRIGSTPIHHP